VGHQPYNTTKYETFSTKVHDNCQLKNVLLDAETLLDEGVKLLNEKNLTAFEDPYIVLIDGIIVTKRFAHIPKNYRF